jgi:hypothetical protein
MALLGDYTDNEDASIRIGAIMGLGIAYAGSQNEQVSCFSLYFLILVPIILLDCLFRCMWFFVWTCKYFD